MSVHRCLSALVEEKQITADAQGGEESLLWEESWHEPLGAEAFINLHFAEVDAGEDARIPAIALLLAG